jgi:hypothetical protein
MGRSIASAAPAWARDVRARIEEWRRNKKIGARIPESLWAAAVRLARKHGVNPVARALGLDYYSLQRRVVGKEKRPPATKTAPTPRFVEVDLSEAFGGSGCVVELEHPSGAKMTLRFSGREGMDLAALTTSFWSQTK